MLTAGLKKKGSAGGLGGKESEKKKRVAILLFIL
jgi:hypothetical protein